MIPEEIVKQNQEAAKKAVEVMGGPANAARLIAARVEEDELPYKVRIGSVWAWMNRDKCGVPIFAIKYIEDLTNIPREELRPDIPWRNL